MVSRFGCARAVVTAAAISTSAVVAAGATNPLPHNPECTLKSFAEPAPRAPSAVLLQLAPTGLLAVGINHGNPNNATITAAGKLQGVAVDLGCMFARQLGVEVQFLRYGGVAELGLGFARREWTLAFSADPDLGPRTYAYAHSHIGVENTYLVAPATPFQTSADVDQAGVAISVARGNSPDIYLSANLKRARLVRFDTVPQALAALKDGQVQAFAGSRSAAIPFQSQIAGSRLLEDNFLIAHIAPILAPDADEAVDYVSRFVENAKLSYLIQLAILRAGLTGVSIPEPVNGTDPSPGGRCVECRLIQP